MLLGIDKKAVKKFQADMLTYFDSAYPEIGQEIEDKKELSDELIEKIVKTAKEYKETVQS